MENIEIPQELQEQYKEFLSTLDNKELQALVIANDHLGSSFDMEKSIKYKEWKNKMNE
jgi:hypothetical protein